MSDPVQHRPPLWPLLPLGVAVLVWSIWEETSITGKDEYWLSLRTPMEMLARDSWVTPMLDGVPRLKKPPLLYWLVAWSYDTFGINLASARIWGVLFGAGFAYVTARLHRLLFGSGGFLAGMLVLSAVGIAVESRRMMLDLPMGFFTIAAVWQGAAWLRSRRIGHLVLAAVALGGASMTKGPVTLLFTAAAAVAAVIAFGVKRHGTSRPPLWHVPVGLVVFAAIAVPWPLLMAQRWPEFMATLTEQAENREFSIWRIPKSLPSVLGGALGLAAPWSLAFLHGAWHKLRTPGDPDRAQVRWLLLWCVVATVPFLFMKSFERYLIPLVCPITIVAARWLPAALERQRRFHLVLATALIGVPVLAFSAFELWFGLAWVWPLIACAFWVVSLRMVRRRPEPMLAAACIAVTITLYMGPVYTAVGINELPDDLPPDLSTRRVAVYERSQPAMLSMRAGKSIEHIRELDLGRDELEAFAGYLFVFDDELEEVKTAARELRLDVREVQAIPCFYSQKVWLRFMKRGLKGADWWDAIKRRSVDDLRPLFHCLEVTPKE